MKHDDQEDDLDDDLEDDEPIFWEVLEGKYGRELTESEVRLELKADYEREFLDLELYAEEFEEDVGHYQDWLILKEELQQRAEEREAESLEKDAAKARAKVAAEDLMAALCRPPLDENDDLVEGGWEQWNEAVNKVIRERIDFSALLAYNALVRESALKGAAQASAGKRHKENRAMKAEVFEWLDKNAAQFRSLDSMATAIAGKVAPIAFRTARAWVGEHRNLRSASTE